MDANGLRSFGLALHTGTQPGGLHRWPLGPEGARLHTVEPNPQHRLVAARLASAAAALPLAEVEVDPAQPPACLALRDAYGHALVWSQAERRLWSLPAQPPGSAQQPPLEVLLDPVPAAVHDLALTAADVLAVASGALQLRDTRARFAPAAVALPAGFSARRLAADPAGGLYLLDTGSGRLLHLTGTPLPATGLRSARGGERFAAVELNPNPVTLRAFDDAQLPAGETALDLACSAQGALLLLTRSAAGARLRMLTDDGRWSGPLPLARPARPHSLGWLDDAHAVLLTRATVLAADGTPDPARDAGAFVFALPADEQRALRRHGAAPDRVLAPGGEYYPLRELVAAPLVRSAAALVADASGAARLFYPRATGIAGLPCEPAPLARLAGAARAAYGVLANTPRRAADEPPRRVRAEPGVIDCGQPAGVWHRLHVEACVPRNCALVVWLAANDGTAPVFEPLGEGDAGAPARRGWHPHLVGQLAALPAQLRAALPADMPRAAWIDAPSEVPQGASLLGCPRERDASGLFTLLVQRAGLAVRSLAGRRLWVTVELFGDGRAAPELVALRAYAGRVSYRDKYLPALYREQLFGPQAELPARATGADFLERLLDLFEGVFTGIEDRIAQSYRLTDAFSAPPDALPWLASWIGLALEPGVPERRARWMIANAPQLARRHGTLDGLKLALDIATDGGVTRGRLVVIEDFRLRRTMATILGARLEDADDPLTAGIARSGNSVVGDSLFLGDEHVKTFLALFRELQVDPAAGHPVQRRQQDERAAAQHALYDGLAWRVTVLVHEDAGADEQRLVRRLAQDCAPAHVRVRVAAARYPFLAAVAALVGADSFLRAPEAPAPVQLDRTRLGWLDSLQGLGTLDARGGALDAR